MNSPASMPPLKCQRPRTASGFTLVETLFVLAIMVMLFAVAAAGAKKSWQSQELRASVIHLAHDMNLASVAAQRLNKPVVVRFYLYQADAIASPDPHYHAYQLMVHDAAAGTTVPLYELQTLEGTTLISANPRFSSILYTPQTQNPAQDPDLGIGPYQYVDVEFRPNSSTNLATNVAPWTITLIPARAADDVGTLPTDYQALCVHPDSGTVHIY